MIAYKFFKHIGLGYSKPVTSVFHNYMEEKTINNQEYWLHRKGATPADKGFVIIPGSRGDYSYIVSPITENVHQSCYSLAHGAGRRLSRADALEINRKAESQIT